MSENQIVNICDNHESRPRLKPFSGALYLQRDAFMNRNATNSHLQARLLCLATIHQASLMRVKALSKRLGCAANISHYLHCLLKKLVIGCVLRCWVPHNLGPNFWPSLVCQITHIEEWASCGSTKGLPQYNFITLASSTIIHVHRHSSGSRRMHTELRTWSTYVRVCMYVLAYI